MAMAQTDFPRELLYNYIQSLYKEFMSRYQDNLASLKQFSINDEYSNVIKEKMDFYNKNKNEMKGDELLLKLEEGVKAMKVNLIKTGGSQVTRNASK